VPEAFAADMLYWANGRATNNQPGPGISFANLDGSGGGQDLTTTGAQINGPAGTTIDSAAGRIYWANSQGNSISWANLDGTGGGNLNTTGAQLAFPLGVAIDPAQRRIYWANYQGGGSFKGSISWASLKGTGGGNLSTNGATVDTPVAVVVDPSAGRIYWANDDNNSGGGGISWANLNGSGGGDLTIPSGADVYSPYGVAIDGATNTIYWANLNGVISYASLDGSTGGTLSTTGAGTVNVPEGLAIDPSGGKLYWGNYGAGAASIAYANLNGTGGGPFDTTGATNNGDSYPSLLKAPQPEGAPTITASSSLAALSCSQGSWAGDQVESFLYQAPHTYSYQWNQSGNPIAGANSASYSPSSSGDYSCTVTAANQAGSAQQTSETTSNLPLHVSKRGPGHGNVTSAPNGISCGSSCSAEFAPGTTVRLTATALPGSKFTGWSGACSGTGACTVTENAATNVTAGFTLMPPNTTITKESISRKAGSATFAFKASAAASHFQCALVKQGSGSQPRPAYASCSSPKSYRHLRPGDYTFLVRALDAGGADPTPARGSFTI
jgi:hypothetical protein